MFRRARRLFGGFVRPFGVLFEKTPGFARLDPERPG